VVVDPDGPDERHLLKVNALPLGAGTTWELKTGGGGGFGDPLERDPGRVREDVLDGYVTRAGAKSDYGVVLRDDLTVDADATGRLRAESRSS
jgi:N-methylhydantoinase B